MILSEIFKQGNYEKLGDKCAKLTNPEDVLKQNFAKWFNFTDDEKKFRALRKFMAAFLSNFVGQKMALQKGMDL